ncbi:MAG: twin-arginine translocase subunit TatC [Polyangiales bacterium]|nr:twin-arginine translocase subunit TatC [Myxococcales bacterium]MCB9659938.1 twin-arginine translocase subunit TatC [Sandaracinaceae bacterium]
MSDDAAAIKAAKEAEAIRAAKIAAAKKPVQPTEAQPRPEDDLEMGFFEHVGELRTRLVRAVVGAIPTIFLAWVWKQEILELLLRPWIEAWERLGLGRPTIHFSGPVDMFVIYLKNSVIAGLILASPWVFWQVWGFISPGLYRRERRMAIPFVLASTLFFVGGVAFGYVVVFPEGFRTFLEYAEQLPSDEIQIVPTVMITEYMSFSTKLLLGFGVVFEVPVVVSFLAAVELVNWRGLLAFGRWWLLVAAIIAAFLTPPDVVSQLMMLIPLVVLYFVAVFIAFLIEKSRGKRKAEDDKAATDEGYER